MHRGPHHTGSQPSNPQPQAAQLPAVLQASVQPPAPSAMLPAAQAPVPQSSTLSQPPSNPPPLAVQFQIQGTGPPLVLVQGFPFNSSIWSGITPALSQRYTLHTWDLPINGIPSNPVKHRFMLKTQSRNLNAMLNARFNVQSVVVIAHGIGASVALDAHSKHKARYRALILVSPIAHKWAIPFFTAVRQSYESYEGLHLRLHGACVREFMTSASLGALPANSLNQLSSQWTGSVPRQLSFYHYARGARNSLSKSFPRGKTRYDKILFPVHICMGQDDEWVERQQMEGLWGRFTLARMQRVVLPGGHLVPLEQPQALVGFIDQCLASLGNS